MSLPRSARLAAFFTFCLAALATAAPAADPPKKWDPSRTTAPEDIAEAKSLEASVVALAEKCSPATVAILFGNSSGTGVIVSEDGLVLTAAHVIRDYKAPTLGRLEGEPLPFTSGKSVTIRLQNGDEVAGKTLGINAGDDSGMIQITEKKKAPKDGKWPFQPVGKSGALKKGQWVVALGHPNGPKEGRVPVERLGRVQETTKTTIRTNCPVVGGDSGGPLFDLDGNVVGITSRIGLPLTQNLHVPTDRFKSDWDALYAGDWVDRPAAAAYLGVVFPDNEEDDAWLREVEADGPAEKGGLKSGDTITKFNDTVVKSVKQFRKLMEKAKPGSDAKFVIRRGTSTLNMTVKLGKRDA